MPGWDDVAAGGGGWDANDGDQSWNDQPALADNFTDNTNTFTNGTDGGGFKDDDYISKHANGDFEAGSAGGGDRGPIICRNCNQPGHIARECPEPKKMTGECFNCGEVGHNKADCSNPKVERAFTGNCPICNQEGHRATDCPQKPPDKCKNCGGEGHKAAECELNRVIDRSEVPSMTTTEAWGLLEQAASDRDVDDFRQGVRALAKADPELSYLDLERQFRQKGMKLYLIATHGDCPPHLTRVNLQGKKDCDYNITYAFAATPKRSAFKNSWPSQEENLERLTNAGEPMKQIIPVCRRCNQLGHISKNCDQEPAIVDDAALVCENCGSKVHRLRDCPAERVEKPRGSKAEIDCRKCGEMGHMAKDCPNPGSGGGGTCHNCGEEGHMARDCEKPRAMSGACRNCGEEGHMAKDCEKPRIMKCRNCDAEGHMSRECPEPKDWSRVKCRNCGEMGHGAARCPKPSGEQDDGGLDSSGGFGANTAGDGFDAPTDYGANIMTSPDVAAQNSWETPAISTGAW